jgi:hypothetical protein
MNRHARRRAAALARSPTGYLHRVTAAMANGAISPKPGVHIANIEHGPGCGIYRGTGCDCVPDISVSGPDGITTIDADGLGTKQARQ